MEQTERITLMEERLDRATLAARQLMAALDVFAEAQDDIRALESYYGSDEWKKDYDDDAAGLVPADVKRGVLSEDAVWNLLGDCRELNVMMLEMVAATLRGN